MSTLLLLITHYSQKITMKGKRANLSFILQFFSDILAYGIVLLDNYDVDRTK